MDPLEFPENLLCSEDSIADLLISLDTSKSSGVDGISAKMLKSTAYIYSITSSITNLYNRSLTTGTYPTEWKRARIVPVPKSDCPHNSVSEYRPILILPVISKVLKSHGKNLFHEQLAEMYPMMNL